MDPVMKPRLGIRASAALRAGVVQMALAVSPALVAQSQWSPTGLPGLVYSFFQLYEGDLTGSLYYAGYVDVDTVEPSFQKALLRYSDGHWDTLSLNCYVRSVVEFHDTLFIAGECGDPPTDTTVTIVKYWDGTSWMPYGEFSNMGPRKLRVINDTLYLVGSFYYADGQLCKGITRRVGGQWVPLPLLEWETPIITDIIEFEGDLVVCGSVYVDGTRGIARLHNGVWQPFDQGILGGQSSVFAMCVYQGDLYVGGDIRMADGNPGRDILRWNNGGFHAVGASGLQRILGSNAGTSSVWDIVSHNGLMYVGGGFRYADGIDAKGLATWDGAEWCGVEGNISDGNYQYLGAQGIAFYSDTLFIACGAMLDSMFVNNAAKFTGTDPVTGCSGDNGITSVALSNTELLVGSDQLVVAGLGLGQHPYAIYDATGRVVAQGVVHGDSRSGATVDMRALARGSYAINCGERTLRFLKQ